ncbi:TonB-dependent receptor [Sphingomonas sp. MG17]|uniref:TonB-dependent receptor n=1 Tax=Sphingomonas tagetis TaxID=2949092 RepID=A0A9X2KNV1_9SPHN|nr:TonB-dependent receptor [Sphingomonas tagetis]MCP3733227.1 TonB-dependent receptor [Sphingomonas tagetis]
MKSINVLTFVSPVAMLAASTAYAQDAPPAQAAAETPSEARSSEDIVVTARRREENLQDVPISITAVSGETLVERGVRDALDLQSQTPSLSVTGSGASRTALSYAIRGQRTNEAQMLTDPPVGLYFAEVVAPRSYGFGTAFYDLQNVQVLKGVQGTLFGRNMTGGAVLVEPNHPNLKEFQLEGTAQYGNYDLVDLYGMVNLPVVSDTFAIRAAGKFRDRKGYTTEVSTGRRYDDQHYHAFRVSAELHLDRLTSFLVFDYLNQQETGAAIKLTNYTLTDTINGNATVLARQVGAAAFFPAAAGAPMQNAIALLNRAVALGRYQVDYGNFGVGPLYTNDARTPRNNVKNWGITNKTTFDAGDVTFKNIFGYREATLDLVGDYDGSPVALLQPHQTARPRQISEEFQMQGTPFGSALDLTMGAYYFREWGRDGAQATGFPQVSAIGLASATPALAAFFLAQPAQFYEQSTVASAEASSWAVYAAGTMHVSDQFSLSGGIRYNNDYRRATREPFYTNLAIPGTPISAPCYWNGVNALSRANCARTSVLKNDAVTWDVTAQWQPSDDLTAYLAARKGYRSGGFSLRATNDVLGVPFQPENVQEYEGGLKNVFRFGGGRLNTSIAVYYQNYTNVQKQNALVVNGQVATIISNTAKQRNYGGEFEASLSLSNGLGANFFYSYAKNEIVSGANGSFPQQGVPEHQVGGGLTYEQDVGIGRLNANVNATYRSGVQLDEFDVEGFQKGYALVNARIAINDISGSGIGLALWGKNLTDEYYKQGVISLMSNGPILNGVNPGGAPGFSNAVFGEPRTYGVEASFKF